MPFSPKFTITNSITSSLSSIERTRGFLEAANLSRDWIEKMQNRALILEAHSTTHIEGTHLNLGQSERLLSGEDVKEVDTEDVTELLNYKKAFDFVADYVLTQGIISESLIREIHRRLVLNVRNNSAQPGLYRVVQNFVANSITKKIIYTPPTPYEVPMHMTELVEWLQKEKSISPILVAGIAQFQLVHIHPFLDGNGRTARLLSTLYLYRSGYDFKKLFTISEYYDRNRHDYYLAIQSVRSNNMDLTVWLEYFVAALETQMHEIQLKGSRAIKLDIMVLENHLSLRQKQAINLLQEIPNDFSIQEYEHLMPNINRRSLQRDLLELTAKGFLIKMGSNKGVRYKINF